MRPPYSLVIIGLWIAWMIYWWISASKVKTTVRTESLASRAAHMVPLLVAGTLVMIPNLPAGWLFDRMLPWDLFIFWLGAAILAAGLAVAVWARVYLGRNWSGVVTIKQDHELVPGGPYGLARHPIYTGILIAFVGTAIARGEWRGLLAVVIVFASLWRKLKLEERWLGETFGASYAKYRAEVSALIPYLL
jgi:protein-S-isoprenylcysteine O-methyltransferase Ste14